uniref:RHS repeat domain-containing protein n=1 Tax=Flagellimonas sp. 389 TaxID=2835862 RepID=UPI001DBC6BEB
NGNMTSDLNKGISSIEYNHLNLPTKVTVTGSNAGTIDYVYDATGAKLRKEVSTGAVTEYAGNHVYSGNATSTSLQFFSHPEGYVNVENNGYRYVYQYLDHLGNVRVSYTEDPSNPGQPTIIEENNYYPFGLKHKGYNSGGDTALGNDVAQKWKYNGKELQDEMGLDMYDYGARNYDPALGRWFGIDELAEDYSSLSPYAFVGNNPMTNLEIDGRFWIRTVDENGNVSYTAEEGDSAQSLYEQFGEQDGFDAETADYMIQNLFGENRVEDGEAFSNIDPEDSFTLFSEDTSEVIDGDQRIQVVDNDSDVEETDLSTVDMGGTQIDQTTLEKRDNRKALVIMAEGLHPKNKIPEFGLKGLKMWGGRKTSRSSFGSRGTTSSSSRVNTELKAPVQINSTRPVNVRGHFRTLKSGKKVWVRPHIRNIKNTSN